jgi:hypothetical protein
VELDSDDEKQAMATQSGIDGWHLGVPSWIEHVKQRETKTQRRKLASKRKWEDEEADVADAGLAVRDIKGVVTMVDGQRKSFAVVDGDVYVPFTANAATHPDELDWGESLKVGDELTVRAVLKPQGKNKWYGFRAERTKKAPSKPGASNNETAAAAAASTSYSSSSSAAAAGGGSFPVHDAFEGEDDDAAGAMASSVMAGFAREKKLKKEAKRAAKQAQRLVLPVDPTGTKKGLRWQGGAGSDGHWLGLLSGEVEFGGGGLVSGLSEFGSVCVTGVSLERGKWYYECELRSNGVMQVGWADHLFTSKEEDDGVGDDAHSWAYDGCRQRCWTNGESSEYGLSWQAGDVVGCLLDLDNNQDSSKEGGGGGGGGERGTLSFTLNGEAMPVAFSGVAAALTSEPSPPAAAGAGAASSSSSPSSSSSSATTAAADGGGGFYPAVAVEDGEVLVLKVNRRDMRFGPPQGFKAVGEAMACPPGEEDDQEEKEGRALMADEAAVDPVEKGEEPAAAASPAPAAATATPAPPAAPAAPPAVEPPVVKAAPVVAQALDLSGVASCEELAALGLDRLKAALMALGVKCGGSLQQRAERLWALKGVSPDDILPSLRAQVSTHGDGAGGGGGGASGKRQKV